ncbi:MAG: thermonuclease family protein [Pseudonocardiaceae bacterium]
MIEPIQIMWSPAGVTLQSVGARALIDVTDGDTPNIRMPIRMLSVDTPEVTARSAARAREIDEEFRQLAEWIGQGRAPISMRLGEVVAPKLATGRAGTLQFQQGNDASAFAKANVEQRLTRPNGSKRNIFTRIEARPFDDNGRLLAYVAPDYSAAERRTLTRRERATFNLDLVAAGWAAPFVIYPSIPGELDLPLLIEAAVDAATSRRGIWASDETLPAYEYRAMEKLYRITKKIVEGGELRAGEAHSWRERYCADMRTRTLHGPEDYSDIPPPYRLWIWPDDVSEAVGRLNLVPTPRLVGAA